MGQAKKRRACPAVGREITSAECGDNRHSRYACPAGCAFNPFALANYAALLEAEEQLDALTIRRLLGESPAAGDLLQRAANDASGHALHATTVWQLFFAADSAGRTFATRWEQAGFPELRNDQRTFFRGKMRMRVALLEIQCVRDDRQIDAVDLLDPAGPVLRLVDRSLAARAGRFMAFLTWLYPLPHFWRMAGTGILVPDFGPHRPQEIVRECVAHLGGPAEPAAQGRWLAENFVRLDGAITATANERRRRMFAGLDAQWGAATYEWCAPFAAGRAALAAARDTDEDELTEPERGEGFAEALVWFEPEKSKVGAASVLVPGGRRVLGRVLLAPDRVRVEAIGAARLDELRRRFEARLGAKVRFSKERRDNLGAQMAAREPAADLALVPPRLLEEVERLDFSSSRVPSPPPGVSLADHQAELLQAHRRAFADSPVPALDGKTPREAAGDLLLRPRLLALLKSQVRQLDEQNLRSGRRDDLNWLLRDLGLAEIDFPPPPPRAVPSDDEDEDDDEDELGEDFAADPDDDTGSAAPSAGEWVRPDPGALPEAPLSLEESLERLDVALAAFARAADALEALDREGATIIAEADELTRDWTSDDEFSFLVPLLLQVWFALVPRDARPALRADVMAAAMAEDAKLLQDRGRPALVSLGKLLGRCRQPHFFQAMVGGLIEAAEKAPKKMRPSPEAIVGMVLALKTVIDEIDVALRRRAGTR